MCDGGALGGGTTHLVEVLRGGEGGGSAALFGCVYGHPTQHVGHFRIVFHIQLARLLKNRHSTHSPRNSNFGSGEGAHSCKIN